MQDRQDINEVLAQIQDEPFDPPQRRRIVQRPLKPKRDKKSRTPLQKWRRRIIILLIVALLGVAGFYVVKTVLAASKVLHGNLISLITPGTPLATDSSGRTNILVFGTSQDDTAHQDAVGGGGLWLTDSIMLISLDQSSHVIKMISIPRDLWVAMPSGCAIGDEAKINAVYECGNGLYNDTASEQNSPNYPSEDQAGAQALEATVEQVTGVTPQYYVHVNYTVLKQAVDAIGGIQVDIEGDGANGIYDTNFDWDCPNGAYTCKNVYYPSNGTYTLDGTQALFLARARGDTGLYSYKDFGLDRGDFDRQANQQKIITAIKNKVVSAGTLLNPLAMANLVSALGNNVTTDLQTGNDKTLISFIKAMPKTNGMQSISLVQDGKAVVESSMIDGQSVEVGTSGVLDYTSISNYIAQQLSDNPAISEGASIAVYNASGTAGAAGALQTKLSAAGFTVLSAADADSSDVGSAHYTIYDTTGGQDPKTLSYLESTYGMTLSSSAPPSDIVTQADIVVIIGPGTASTSN